MSQRLEWRTGVAVGGDEEQDVLLAVEEENGTVVRASRVEADLLRDFLTEMTLKDGPAVRVSRSPDDAIDGHDLRPEDCGELVMSRAHTGEVLWVDPELYWEGIAKWFRSRGVDPHQWTEVHPPSGPNRG